MDNLTQLKNYLDQLDKYDQDDANRQEILKTVWLSGKVTHEYCRETGRTIKSVAREIEAVEGILEKHVRLYKFYPDTCPASEIDGKPVSWSHYLAVLYVRQAKVREYYLKIAAAEGWSSHELRRRIRYNFYENRKEAQDAVGTRENRLREIDQNLYIYAATVIEIIDTDTHDLDIDMGIHTHNFCRIRLRGINAPERGTVKGDEATAFVKALMPSGTLVVVRTYKSEKFGRYLVDMWFLPGEKDREKIYKEGKLLNQVLLDKGLAEKVE